MAGPKPRRKPVRSSPSSQVNSTAENQPMKQKSKGLAACVAFLAFAAAAKQAYRGYLSAPNSQHPYVLRSDSGEWLDDPEPSEVLHPLGHVADGQNVASIAYCDLERVHASEIDSATFERRFRGPGVPVVIDGLIDSWPAFRRWTRPSLMKRFGNRTVAAGDGANIVQTGGHSGAAALTLAKYLDLMSAASAEWKKKKNSTHQGECSGLEAGICGGAGEEAGTERDLFNFDADFLDAMPELARDFSVPELFWPWAGKGKRSISRRSRGMSESDAAAPASSIFSLGATRSGLPWHVHGETWLGLVFGLKRWFLYAPVEDAPLRVHRRTTFARPLMSSWEWLRTAYPQIKEGDSAERGSATPSQSPVGDERSAAGGGKGRGGGLSEGGGAGSGRGLLECVQRPGEVVYLPRGWKHLTLNVGEAVGVGGQVPYGEGERFEDGLASLARNPNDLLALKGVGLSLAQQGMMAGGGGGGGESSSSSSARAALARSVSYFARALELCPAHPEIAIIGAEVLHFSGLSDRAATAVANCAKHYEVEFVSSEEGSGGDDDHRNNAREGQGSSFLPGAAVDVVDGGGGEGKGGGGGGGGTNGRPSGSTPAANPAATVVASGRAARGLSRAKLATAHLNFGRGFMAIDRPALALAPLEVALRLNPSLAAAHLTLGQAYALLAASPSPSLSLTPTPPARAATASPWSAGGAAAGRAEQSGALERSKSSRLSSSKSVRAGGHSAAEDAASRLESAERALASLLIARDLSPHDPSIAAEVRRVTSLAHALRTKSEEKS